MVAIRRSALVLAIFVSAFFSMSVSADEEPLKEITVDTITAGGALDGCAINFKVADHDYVYQQGGQIAVTGSLYWKMNAKGALLMIKVLGFDFVPAAVPPLQSFTIPHAFLVLNDTPQLPDRPMSCDNPNGYCGLYFTKSKPFDAMQPFLQGGETAVIKYNRKVDGMDAPSTSLDGRSKSEVRNLHPISVGESSFRKIDRVPIVIATGLSSRAIL